MKQSKLTAALMVALLAAAVLPVSAETAGTDPAEIAARWERFLLYDLHIRAFDALTETEQALAREIFETEQAADGMVICERARRQLAGLPVGERITLEQCEQYQGLTDRMYGTMFTGKTMLLHAVPDRIYINDRCDYEYWLDDAGTEKIVADMIRGQQWFTWYPAGETKGRDWYFSNDEPETLTEDGYSCCIFPDGTAALTAVPMDAAVLDIPAEIGGHPVTVLCSYALYGAAAETVTLPDPLLCIEPLGLAGCRNLTALTLPEGLQFLGALAMMDCPALETVVIHCPQLRLPVDLFYGSHVGTLDIDMQFLPYYTNVDTYIFGESAVGADAMLAAGGYTLPESVWYLTCSEGTNPVRVPVPPQITMLGGMWRQTGIDPLANLSRDAYYPLNDPGFCPFPRGTVLVGQRGTAAEAYAAAHGLPFLAEGEAWLSGDLNGDSRLGLNDMILLQKWLLCGQEARLPVPENADLNGDGRVSAADLSLLKQRLLRDGLTPPMLTMEQAEQLAARGKAVTWAELSAYACTMDAGSLPYRRMELPIAGTQGGKLIAVGTTTGGITTLRVEK